MKWSHFDNWIVKVAGFVAMTGGLAWSAYAVYFHYHIRQTSWEYFPFAAGGIAIVFGAALLSKKAAEGATAVILPLLDRFRPGVKGATSTEVVPAQPAKLVTTTVLEAKCGNCGNTMTACVCPES